MTTNVPAIQFTSTGLVLPTGAQVLAGTQADINAAFGGTLNQNLATPQGQLAQSEAAIIEDKNAQIAQIVNQVDPQFAAGRMQDAIGYIYFMTRLPAEPTSVLCTLNGLPGTVIPVNAQAVDTNGNVYLNVQSVTIPGGGTITGVQFNAAVAGPLICAPGALNGIYKAIPGWDTITNPAAGIVGQNIETQQQFEFRRQNSVAGNATGLTQSIYASLFAPPVQVLDAYVIDNPADTTLTIGAVTLAAHSIYVCTAGGSSQANIANAIWSKKSGGCNYNGNTTVVVTDTAGYSPPYPTYNVIYQTAIALPIYIAVTVQNQSGMSQATLTPLIQAAIQAAFTGADGGLRSRIGSTIYAARYYAGVSAIGALAIVSIFIGTAPSPSANLLTVPIDHVPTLSNSNITVTYA